MNLDKDPINTTMNIRLFFNNGQYLSSFPQFLVAPNVFANPLGCS